MNFEEFLQFLLDKRHLTDPEADIRNAFQLFDKDADGYLTAKDLKQVFSATFCTFQVIHLSVSNLTTSSIRYTQHIQVLIRRWDSERELLRSAPRKLPEFAEITQNNGHYAVQGHLRSLILVPAESHTISY